MKTDHIHLATGPSVVIVRDGRERPVYDLNRGDRIAFRDFDVERQCYVFYVVTEVPASAEVAAAGWDCEDRGHRFVQPNGVPSGRCVECGETSA
jgi:hypothetical protein